MFSRLGRVPEVGDDVVEGGYLFRVDSVDESRIERLVVEMEQEDEGDAEAVEDE